MKNNIKYTMADAIRMGFTEEQVCRMVDKIQDMPKHHKFWIGPVGCSKDSKLQFRIERKCKSVPNQQSYNCVTKYMLYDEQTNKLMAYSFSSRNMVYDILKMVDHWNSVLQSHRDSLKASTPTAEPSNPIRRVCSKLWNQLISSREVDNG